jgi:hypothetical protein
LHVVGLPVCKLSYYGNKKKAAAKSLSVFLEELAARQPDVVLSCLSLLLSHLEGESYATF